MDLKDKKEAFIQNWGKLSSNWGVCKGMAQIHALLLISHKPMSATCIQEALNLSSGSVNMHIRELIEWGLIYKTKSNNPEKPDTRKEYFVAEKDMTTVFKQILSNRKKRELEPILELINEVGSVPLKCDESKEFTQVLSDIKDISSKVDKLLDNVLLTDKNWMVNTFLRFVK